MKDIISRIKKDANADGKDLYIMDGPPVRKIDLRCLHALQTFEVLMSCNTYET